MTRKAAKKRLYFRHHPHRNNARCDWVMSSCPWPDWPMGPTANSGACTTTFTVEDPVKTKETVSKYQLLFTFKLKRFRINKLFYITLYKSVTKKRISKTKANVMFFGHKRLLGGQTAALGWTEERSFKCINYICTIRRYLSEVCPCGQTSPQKKKKKAIITEYLLLISDIQKYSSDCLQIILNKPAGKKIKTENGFPLRNQRTCIYLNVIQQTTRYSKYWQS